MLVLGKETKEAEGNKPNECGNTEVSYEVISLNMIEVKVIPFNWVEFLTKIMAAESINWWCTFKVGNFFLTVFSTVFLYNLEEARTLALCKYYICIGGLYCKTKKAAFLVILQTSST